MLTACLCIGGIIVTLTCPGGRDIAVRSSFWGDISPRNHRYGKFSFLFDLKTSFARIREMLNVAITVPFAVCHRGNHNLRRDCWVRILRNLHEEPARTANYDLVRGT